MCTLRNRQGTFPPFQLDLPPFTHAPRSPRNKQETTPLHRKSQTEVVYWGACSPFVSIGLAKSIVLTNALVPDLDALAAFGRVWLCVICCSLLSESAPSLSLAFAVPMYALYLENQSNWLLTFDLELNTSICELDWPKIFLYFAFLRYFEPRRLINWVKFRFFRFFDSSWVWYPLYLFISVHLFFDC